MRPDVSDEEIGMRSFQLRKQKATELALEKIRFNLGSEWRNLDSEQIELLEWVLGEIWAFIARSEWEHIAFSELTFADVSKIIDIAGQIIAHKKIGSIGLNEINKMIKKLSSE